MRCSQWLYLAAISTSLAACQGISATTAAKLPMLQGLPLLTVQSVQSNTGGYTAKLTGEDKTTYLATVSRAAVTDYVRLAAGDRVKIDGDYADENPVKIQAIQVFKIR